MTDAIPARRDRLYQRRDWLWMGAVAVLYVVVGMKVREFISYDKIGYTLWAPSGLALAAVLLFGRKFWPAVFIGALVLQIEIGPSVEMAAAVALGKSLSVLLAAWVMRAVRFDEDLVGVEDYFILIFAAGAGSAVNTLIGCGALWLTGYYAPTVDPVVLMLHWWKGDVLGTVLVVPLLLVWRRLPQVTITRWMLVEASVCAGCTLLYGQMVLLGWRAEYLENYHAIYMAFALVIWAAMRFGRHGVLLILALLTLEAVLGYWNGVGYFAEELSAHLWFFLAILSFTGVALALSLYKREQAVAALRKSEESYRRQFDANTAVMLLINPDDARIIGANQAAARFYGYTRERLLAMSVTEINTLPEAQVHALMDSVGIGRSARFETRHRLADGTVREVEVFSSRIFIGQNVALHAIVVDISERKQVAEIRRDAEEQWKAIINTSPDGIVLVSLAGVIRFASNHALQQMGYGTQEEVLGRQMFDFLDPADRGKAAAFFGGLLQNNSTGAKEYRLVRKNDTRFFAEIKGEVLHASNGVASKVFLVVRDIDERKRADLALQANEEKYRGLFEGMSEGVFYQQEDGAIVDVNAAALQIFGLNREEFIGHKTPEQTWRVIHEDGTDFPAEQRPSLTALRTGLPVRGVVLGFYNVREQRVRWLNVNAEPLFLVGAARAHQVFVTLHDITERKRAEEAREESEARLTALLESTNDHVFSVDPERFGLQTFNGVFGRYIFAHHGIEIRAGHTPEDLLPPPVAAQWREIFSRALREGSVTTEYNTAVGGSVLMLSINLVRREGAVFGISVFGRDITELRRSERSRRDSERFANATLNALGSHLAILDDQGCIIAVNHAWRQFGWANGMTRDSVFEGVNYLEVCESARGEMGEEGVRFANGIREVIAGHAERFEMEYDCHAPWEKRWFLGRVTRIAGEGSARVVVVHENVTGLKLAEEVLRSKDRELLEAQSVARIGSYVYNFARDHWTGSPQLDELFGIGVSGFTRDLRSWLEIVHPDEREALRSYLADEVLGAHKRFDREYRIVRHGDGQERWVHGLGEVLTDEAGRPSQLAGTIQDITERKAYEKRLREQAALLDVTQDAIFVLNLKREITYLNRGAQTLYGIRSDEALGRRYEDMVYRQVPENYESDWARFLESGALVGERNQTRRGGQKIIVQKRATLVRDEKGQPWAALVVVTDITESKRIEAQYLRAQRLENLGALTGGVAHDLNNVFTPILMASEMLEPITRNRQDRELVQLMAVSARRGAAIVQQLLTYGRVGDSLREQVDVGVVLRDLDRLMQETFPKIHTLRVQWPEELWPIKADCTQLHQVLLNLCVNARDAMSTGGTLSVTAANAQVDEEFARQQIGAKAGPHVVIRVADTGSGIPEDIVDKIFDPFFTTKTAGRGTGLGLSTVLSILQAHGGFVNVETQEGRGSTFALFFPAMTSPQLVEREEEGRRASGGRGELVLLADDEPAVRAGLELALTKSGYRVVGAVNGAEAIALFAQHADAVRVVIADLMMPIMDGGQLLHALHRFNEKVPAIVISGIKVNRDELQKIFGGRLRVLTKPFLTEAMLRVVRELIDEAARKPEGG